VAPCRGKKPGGGGGRLLNRPAGAGVYPPGGGATPGKPGGGGGGGAGKPGSGGGKGALGNPGGGGGIPAIPGGKPGGGGGSGGMWDCGDMDATQPRYQHAPDIEWVRLTCATRRRTIGHRDVVVRVHFLFVLRHTGWRAFWHWNIVVRVLYIRANQSTDKYTRRNDSSPSSSGLLVGATFLEVWPSLGCRRGRYTSFRCSGCSSRYFSFFLIMLSSSTFKSLSLFWSASESDAVEESFLISSSRSAARCHNLQVLRECVRHTPRVLFHQGEVSGLLPLCLVLLQITIQW
jgi:hypothetical protein